jgi:hypothetical protein
VLVVSRVPGNGFPCWYKVLYRADKPTLIIHF